MKISQLIKVLEDLKQEYGDQHIWNIEDLDFPLPSSFIIEFTESIKRTPTGCRGGKSNSHTLVDVSLEYEGGVDVIDRCFLEID